MLAQADGTTPELPKRQALLSLRHRRPIVRERAVNVIAAAFSWLHAQPVKAILLVTLALFDAWLFGVHGIAGGIRTVLYEPAWLLALLCSIVVATAFHEIGHASACRFSGARPGEMGVGVYLIWPAFYCDVTEAYRLDRRGRLRTDLGGVYFNGLFALTAGAAYFATGAEALLFAAFVQHLIVLQQLLPLLRFDGYYVLSDLTGVPDILTRIKPIFRSLVRGRRKEPRVAELKPWVRFVVTAYLIVLVPLLTFMIGSIVHVRAADVRDRLRLVLAPARPPARLARRRRARRRRLPDRRAGDAAGGDVAEHVAHRPDGDARASRGWSRGSVLRRGVAVAGVAAVAGATAFVWWPNGDYEPIRPGEKGTIGEAVTQRPRDRLRPAVVHARARAALRLGADGAGARAVTAPRRTTAATRGPLETGAADADARRRGLRRGGRQDVPADEDPATGAERDRHGAHARRGRHEPRPRRPRRPRRAGPGAAPGHHGARADRDRDARPRPRRPTPTPTPTPDADADRDADRDRDPDADGTAHAVARGHRARARRRPSPTEALTADPTPVPTP